MTMIGVLYVHGMGDTEKNYSAHLNKMLFRALPDHDERLIQTHEVYYSPVLQTQQNSLDAVYRRWSPKLGSKRTRRALLSSLGDAGSLLNAHNRTAYKDVQIKIHHGLEALQERIGPNGKIVIVAHSLGVEVVSNYLWDWGRYQGLFSRVEPTSINLKTSPAKQVTHLISMGCNLPLFNSGLNNVKCFESPRVDFKWTNFYSPHDVLGYPLKPLGDDYRRLVEDIEFKVGGFITRYTWLSHMAYWEDRRFANNLAGLLSLEIQR